MEKQLHWTEKQLWAPASWQLDRLLQCTSIAKSCLLLAAVAICVEDAQSQVLLPALTMRHQGGKDNRSVLHIDAAAPIQIQVWHVPPTVCLLVVPPTSLLEFNPRTIEMDWIDVTLQRYFESLQGQKF